MSIWIKFSGVVKNKFFKKFYEMMELHNLDFLMLNYKKQIYIQSNKKVTINWLQEMVAFKELKKMHLKCDALDERWTFESCLKNCSLPFWRLQ